MSWPSDTSDSLSDSASSLEDSQYGMVASSGSLTGLAVEVVMTLGDRQVAPSSNGNEQDKDNAEGSMLTLIREPPLGKQAEPSMQLYPSLCLLSVTFYVSSSAHPAPPYHVHCTRVNSSYVRLLLTLPKIQSLPFAP